MANPRFLPDTGPDARPGDTLVILPREPETHGSRMSGTPAAPPTGVTLIEAHTITPQPVAWLWTGWLARGKLEILAGAPGTGKTTLALALVATITTGGKWPDGTQAAVGDCLIWSGEDDPKDTLIPRLIAAGADLHRVRFIASMTDQDGARAFDPATDIRALDEAIADRPPALLIVDPVVSAVAGDSHKNAEVRRALQPLVDLAGVRSCAVLGITHLTKGSQGRDPTERVTGSLAFGALARLVLIAAKMSEDQGSGRVLARAKSNLGPDEGGFRYDMALIELPGHPNLEASRVQWGESIPGQARDILGTAEAQEDHDERSALDDAKQFLSATLKDGPVPAKVIRREADEAGHAWATVRRGRKAMGITPKKDGGGPWMWHLREDAQGSPTENMSTLSTFDNQQPFQGVTSPMETGARSRRSRGSTDRVEPDGDSSGHMRVEAVEMDL